LYIFAGRGQIQANFKTPKGKVYRGILRQGTSGKIRSDWDFYDDDDDLITNVLVLNYLFDVIEFEDEWYNQDYEIEDDLINYDISANNSVYVEQAEYSELGETETRFHQDVYTPEPAEVSELVEVSEPIYIPEPQAYVPEPQAYVPEPVADVYETTIESKPYESSVDSGWGSSDSSSSYDSGSSDSGNELLTMGVGGLGCRL
jgi:hypothetical protein